jgi:hypothetical protein
MRPREPQDRAEIRQRFSNRFRLLQLEPENWRSLLSTPAAREAFNVEFPYVVLDLWGFLPEASDSCQLFRRGAEFFDGRFPGKGFEPPNMQDVAFADLPEALEAARAAWWIANKLPVTPEERAYALSRKPKRDNAGTRENAQEDVNNGPTDS